MHVNTTNKAVPYCSDTVKTITLYNEKEDNIKYITPVYFVFELKKFLQ